MTFLKCNDTILDLLSNGYQHYYFMEEYQYLIRSMLDFYTHNKIEQNLEAIGLFSFQSGVVMGAVDGFTETCPQPSSRTNKVKLTSHYTISMYSTSSMDAATPAPPATTPWFS